MSRRRYIDISFNWTAYLKGCLPMRLCSTHFLVSVQSDLKKDEKILFYINSLDNGTDIEKVIDVNRTIQDRLLILFE
jgi:hypothetical protein